HPRWQTPAFGIGLRDSKTEITPPVAGIDALGRASRDAVRRDRRTPQGGAFLSDGPSPGCGWLAARFVRGAFDAGRTAYGDPRGGRGRLLRTSPGDHARRTRRRTLDTALDALLSAPGGRNPTRTPVRRR